MGGVVGQRSLAYGSLRGPRVPGKVDAKLESLLPNLLNQRGMKRPHSPLGPQPLGEATGLQPRAGPRSQEAGLQTKVIITGGPACQLVPPALSTHPARGPGVVGAERRLQVLCLEILP